MTSQSSTRCTNCGVDRRTDDDDDDDDDDVDELCQRCHQLSSCTHCIRHLPRHCFSAEQTEICQVLFKIQHHIYFLSHLFTMLVITICCMSGHTDARYWYNKSIRRVPMIYLSPFILVLWTPSRFSNSLAGIKISRFSTNILWTTQVNIIVTIEREQELVYKPSNGVHLR